MKQGTSIALVQRGLPQALRNCTMTFYCYLRNVQDEPADGQTPFASVLATSSKGHSSPLEQRSSTSRSPGNKMLRGKFLGYVQRAEGGWSGDSLIASVDDLVGIRRDHISQKIYKPACELGNVRTPDHIRHLTQQRTASTKKTLKATFTPSPSMSSITCRPKTNGQSL